MKRSGFKRQMRPKSESNADRLRSVPAVTPGAFRAPQPVATTSAEPVPKDSPVRSEAYRRAVASLPCINCGVPGHSQCAHSNSGKGAGIKASDLDSFPLCTVHPGADGRLVQGCHENFDQGALFPKAVRREHEQIWAADTRRRIRAMGLWPKGVPVPDDWQKEKPAQGGPSGQCDLSTRILLEDRSHDHTDDDRNQPRRDPGEGKARPF